MVWYGMVWYGMVWYGMVWYGMVWYGIIIGVIGLSLSYLQNLFTIRRTPYNLRDSEIKLDLAKPRSKYRKRSFGYSGALLWNSLLVNLRQLDS